MFIVVPVGLRILNIFYQQWHDDLVDNLLLTVKYFTNFCVYHCDTDKTLFYDKL